MARTHLSPWLSPMFLLVTACAIDEEPVTDTPSAGGKADEWECEDASWERKTVARVRAAQFAFGFGVSPAGEPRLVFPDPARGLLGAHRTSAGEWKSQLLAPPSRWHTTSLAIAPSGRAHTCYLAPPAGDVKSFACRDADEGGAWGPEVVTSSGPSPTSAFSGISQLAVGPDGGLLLGVAGYSWTERPGQLGHKFDVHAYQQVAYRAPERSRFSFGRALVSDVPTGIDRTMSDEIGHLVLAIDPDLRHHAFMLASTPANYQRDDVEAEWEKTTNQNYFVQPNEMISDARGRLWMASESLRELAVLSFDPAVDTEWQREVVGTTPSSRPRAFGQFSNTGIAFDSQGRAHVVGVASDASPIHAVRLGQDDWAVERIDVENVEAMAPRIAIDAQDEVHVAYWDRALNRLIYARRACSE